MPVLISKCVGKTYAAIGSFYERHHCRLSTFVPFKLSGNMEDEGESQLESASYDGKLIRYLG